MKMLYLLALAGILLLAGCSQPVRSTGGGDEEEHRFGRQSSRRPAPAAAPDEPAP